MGTWVSFFLLLSIAEIFPLKAGNFIGHFACAHRRQLSTKQDEHLLPAVPSCDVTHEGVKLSLTTDSHLLKQHIWDAVLETQSSDSNTREVSIRATQVTQEELLYLQNYFPHLKKLSICLTEPKFFTGDDLSPILELSSLEELVLKQTYYQYSCCLLKQSFFEKIKTKLPKLWVLTAPGFNSSEKEVFLPPELEGTSIKVLNGKLVSLASRRR